NSGVYLYGTGSMGNSVIANFIGTDATGSLSVSNLADGVTFYRAAANVIGGVEPGSGNVISGNGYCGILLNEVGCSNNLIQGNFIGTDSRGSNFLRNGLSGIILQSANANTIGGQSPYARNIISGNRESGIAISTNSNANTIQGNWIGIDVSGSRALANGFDGVSMASCSRNLIGGENRGEGNVISGNGVYGIELAGGSTSNLVKGNLLGTDSTGRA